MSSSTLIKWSGLAAIVAGAGTLLLSAASPSAPDSGSPVVWGFLLTGLMTQFGLIGIYAVQIRESSWQGLIGFVLALSGNAFFILPETSIGGVNTGQVGGGIYALGLLLLAVGTWRARKFPRWIPALWLLAIVVGLPAFFAQGLQAVAFLLGGVLFGAGFIAAGYWLWSGKSAIN
ncbi:MAG TPA: hypothetical protein VJ160_08920 [Anaerolineales bacterium]|nr:hypothetical protein [Anaerolineales bacterium]